MALKTSTYVQDYMLATYTSIRDAAGLALCLCSAEPTTYTQATSTYKLAQQSLVYPRISFGDADEIEDGASGRVLWFGPVIAMTASAAGTATYAALVEVNDTELIHVFPVTSTVLAIGTKITLDEMHFGLKWSS